MLSPYKSSNAAAHELAYSEQRQLLENVLPSGEEVMELGKMSPLFEQNPVKTLTGVRSSGQKGEEVVRRNEKKLSLEELTKNTRVLTITSDGYKDVEIEQVEDGQLLTDTTIMATSKKLTFEKSCNELRDFDGSLHPQQGLLDRICTLEREIFLIN